MKSAVERGWAEKPDSIWLQWVHGLEESEKDLTVDQVWDVRIVEERVKETLAS